MRHAHPKRRDDVRIVLEGVLFALTLFAFIVLASLVPA